MINAAGNLMVIATYYNAGEWALTQESADKLYIEAAAHSEHAERARIDLRGAAIDLLSDELRRLPPQMTRPLPPLSAAAARRQRLLILAAE